MSPFDRLETTDSPTVLSTAQCHFAKPAEIGAMSAERAVVGRGGRRANTEANFSLLQPPSSAPPSLPSQLSPFSVVSRSPFVPSDPISIESMSSALSPFCFLASSTRRLLHFVTVCCFFLN